jgi:putative transcriptional regulator
LVIHPERRPGGRTTLLFRIAPGGSFPIHGHGGLELTLVLDGGFTDSQGHFAAGDVAEVETGTDHQPVIDTGRDCICLVSLDGPLEFRDDGLEPLHRMPGL